MFINWKIRKEYMRREDFDLKRYKRHSKIYIAMFFSFIFILNLLFILFAIPTLYNLINSLPNVKKPLVFDFIATYFSLYNLIFLIFGFVVSLYITYFKIQFPGLKKYLKNAAVESKKTVLVTEDLADEGWEE